MSALLCLGRHTITGWIGAAGRHAVDWSADFRLFERERVNLESLLGVARDSVLKRLSADEPYVVFMDDTLLRKRGREIAGTSWRRDPLGPAFHTNFIWGLRFLQVSAALPEGRGASRARAIPIDLHHCPSPRKPSRKAPENEWNDYRSRLKESNIAQRGVDRLQALREELDRSPEGKSRRLVALVDGSFTNRTVLKSLPPRTTLIGRIRKDAKLYALPTETSTGRGRKRGYGQRLVTPEGLRQDASVEWQSVPAFAAGRVHLFEYKTLAPVRWRTAGADFNLRVVAIRPLAYRLSKGSRMLYRKPVYLLCTDPDLPLDRLIQYYIWRWEIEVNFRDEKTLLGMEQAQVRTPQAVSSVPVFIAASYALLVLAGTQVEGLSQTIHAFNPKWRKLPANARVTTGQFLSCFRKQLGKLGIQQSNFFGFMNSDASDPTRKKLQKSLPHAAFFAHG